MLVDVKNERVDSSLGTRSEQRPSLFSFSSFFFFFFVLYPVSISFRHTIPIVSTREGLYPSRKLARTFRRGTRAETRDRIVASSGETTRSGGTTTTTTTTTSRRLKNFSNSTSLTDRWDTFLPETSHRFDRVLRPFPPPACVFVPLVHFRANRCYWNNFFRQDYSVNSMDVRGKDRTTDWKLFWNRQGLSLVGIAAFFFFFLFPFLSIVRFPTTQIRFWPPLVTVDWCRRLITKLCRKNCSSCSIIHTFIMSGES